MSGIGGSDVIVVNSGPVMRCEITATRALGDGNILNLFLRDGILRFQVESERYSGQRAYFHMDMESVRWLSRALLETINEYGRQERVAARARQMFERAINAER